MGKPMVQWVVEAAERSGVGSRVLVATPDLEIFDACRAFGAEAVMTRADHPSGTDRIAEVADHIQAEVYINVQGDEPLIDPATIEACARPLLEDSSGLMGSVYSTATAEEIENAAAVKVVTDLHGFALYFSRAQIPFPRSAHVTPVKKHVGIYGYRHEVLMEFAKWTQTPLETTESLEQLRFLENGVRIKMSEGVSSPIAVDTPEQAEQVRNILLQK
jgi:3-deoxy-manno-octulosonate cytidylyltransferase (CMP-KDO synthetase)